MRHLVIAQLQVVVGLPALEILKDVRWHLLFSAKSDRHTHLIVALLSMYILV